MWLCESDTFEASKDTPSQSCDVCKVVLVGVVVLVVVAVGCINVSLTRQTSVKSRDFCRAVSSSLINESLSNSAPLLVLRRFSQRCRRMFANWRSWKFFSFVVYSWGFLKIFVGGEMVWWLQMNAFSRHRISNTQSWISGWYNLLSGGNLTTFFLRGQHHQSATQSFLVSPRNAPPQEERCVTTPKTAV